MIGEYFSETQVNVRLAGLQNELGKKKTGAFAVTINEEKVECEFYVNSKGQMKPRVPEDDFAVKSRALGLGPRSVESKKVDSHGNHYVQIKGKNDFLGRIADDADEAGKAMAGANGVILKETEAAFNFARPAFWEADIAVIDVDGCQVAGKDVRLRLERVDGGNVYYIDDAQVEAIIDALGDRQKAKLSEINFVMDDSSQWRIYDDVGFLDLISNGRSMAEILYQIYENKVRESLGLDTVALTQEAAAAAADRAARAIAAHEAALAGGAGAGAADNQ